MQISSKGPFNSVNDHLTDIFIRDDDAISVEYLAHITGATVNHDYGSIGAYPDTNGNLTIQIGGQEELVFTIDIAGDISDYYCNVSVHDHPDDQADNIAGLERLIAKLKATLKNVKDAYK